MKALRTPDDRFLNLPGYDFSPHYAELADGQGGKLRAHYIDEGPRDVAPVLLMHGEPSWCYLYRKVIPPLLEAGHRVIAPDLIGFGRSDKPSEPADYTYAAHVEWMRELLFDHLRLRDITMFCQDWGGLIGLRLVAEHQDRFARVAAGNTVLPVGGEPFPEAFFQWRKFAQETPEFPTGMIIDGATNLPLTPEIVAAYDAPYPDESYKAGARTFPVLVPVETDNPACAANRAAWKVLERFDRPFLTAFSDSDPMTASAIPLFRERVPGAKTVAHTTIKNAGHFLQEDQGEALGKVLVAFIATT